MPLPRYRIAAIVALAALTGCGADEAQDTAVTTASQDTAAVLSSQPPASGNRIAELLASGQPVFGIFSGDHTPEQGARMAALREADFIFYSLEDGPFDIPAMRAYIQAMRDAARQAGVEPRPVLLRVPPITDTAATRRQVQQGLEAGADGIVFPHVSTPEQARAAVEVMGQDVWTADSQGRRVSVAIVEDQEGIANAAQILPVPGLSVVIPGPGDLRRAYDGDMQAVENAIQTVLAGCQQNGVACGITAGVDDIGTRLQQGFRMIIVTEPEALAAGRQAAGRTD